jgi:DDE superfamily endonuclease
MSVRRQKCISIPTLCDIGGDVGPMGSSVWQRRLGEAGRSGFPPLDRALVKAIACEAVHHTGLPLSRLSTADIAVQASQALGKSISPSTVWRILDADAIKPWQYKYWIFPRDSQFADKAGRVLDLYAGYWQGEPLGSQDHIISADEKTSIQARLRCHPRLPPAPGRARRIEHEYARGGALQYLAAWDVRRGIIMGRCEASTGIEPFGRLVMQVMEREPYKAAKRVFWVVDNGSSHRGQAAVRRLATAYTNLIVVHTPVHASWLNQVEIYFSIVQRKVLTPNDFASLEDVEQRLRLYEALANRQPRPFEWKFTRAKLAELLKRLEAHEVMMDQGDAAPEVPDSNQWEPLAA